MQLSAHKTTVARLFGQMGEQFVVPHYQRPYAWLDDNVDDFWGDLIQGIDAGHFMGSLVIAGGEDGPPQVIDGQQRLTTIAILLAQIRDRFTYLGMHQNSANVQTLLQADALADDDTRWKLRTGDANWKVFRSLILRPLEDPARLQFDELTKLSSDERARNSRLIANSLRLGQCVDEMLGAAPPDQQAVVLTKLLRTVAQKLEFVSIHVGTLADAFLLFETLNDRGLDLSAADLLKNHLMARTAARQVSEVGREWERMLADLGSAVDVTLFFRHYLLLANRDVRKEQVYDFFKKQVEKEGPEAVLQELRLYARYYGQFANPGSFSKEEAAVAEVLTDLNTLKATSCFVTLMPARRYLSTDDLVRLARVCEVFVFRANSVLGANSQQVQDQFKRAARVLADSKGARLQDVYAAFRQAMPDREIFVAAFRRQRLGTQYLAKYMLRKIEEELAPTSEVVVQRQGSKLHLEHILPQSLSPAWALLLPDDGEAHADMVGRWGNLTLLDPGLNIKAGNRPFAEKKVNAYQHSVLALNESLKAAATWDYSSIEGRQAWLADVANDVWDMERIIPWDGHQTGVEPTPPAPASGVGLAPPLYELFKSLCHETSYADLVELRPALDVHLGTVEIEAAQRDDVDFPTAIKLHRVLVNLIELGGAMNADERALLRGAIEFFALIGDATNDFSATGFDDDRAVVNSVCVALGVADMQVV